MPLLCIIPNHVISFWRELGHARKILGNDFFGSRSGIYQINIFFGSTFPLAGYPFSFVAHAEELFSITFSSNHHLREIKISQLGQFFGGQVYHGQIGFPVFHLCCSQLIWLQIIIVVMPNIHLYQIHVYERGVLDRLDGRGSQEKTLA